MCVMSIRNCDEMWPLKAAAQLEGKGSPPAGNPYRLCRGIADKAPDSEGPILGDLRLITSRPNRCVPMSNTSICVYDSLNRHRK